MLMNSGMRNESGENLYRRFLEGDDEAFEDFVIMYQDELSRYIYSIVRDYHETEHLTVETFSQMVLNNKKFTENSSIKKHLFSIAKNLSFRQLKKRIREQQLSFEEVPEIGINKMIASVEHLEKIAYTDVLTGAFNRRYFMETAESELKMSTEKRLPYSLIMIDVDFFKKINDTYGHPVGDEVLKILVARMRHTLKHNTVVARYGGDEFVVALPGANQEDAYNAAERIRINAEDSAFVIDDQKLYVTISLGVAAKTKQTRDLSELISNADKALYEAKQTGRNKVALDSK